MRSPRGRRRRMALMLTFVQVVIASCWVVLAPSAAAEVCGGSSGSYQVAWGTAGWTAGPQPRRFEGSKASLLDRGGYGTCAGGNSFNTISTWTAIYGGGGYAQAGTYYLPSYAGCARRWAEQSPSGGPYQDYFVGGCSTPGETHDYWNQSLLVDGAWRMRSNIDTTVIAQSNFNQFNSWGAGDYNVAFASEAGWLQSWIPGRTATPQDFSALQVQDRSYDTWYGTCGNAYMVNVNDNLTRWGIDAPSCNHIRTWTQG